MSRFLNISQADIKPFLKKSNRLAWRALLVNWGLIVAAMALVAWQANLLTVLLALIILGNRQLGLGILMHDCSHSALFDSRRLNQWVGHWLCAAPIFASLEGYRRYHLEHHREAGTINDPDYPNYKSYPVSKSSFKRKVLRDLTGITGVKTFYVGLMMLLGLLDYDMAYKNIGARKPFKLSIAARNLAPPLLVHSLLFTALWLLGQPWLYGLWWLAYFTTFMLFSRIRNAAEHAAVPNLLDLDPRLHARTTYASWWERVTVAPNFVNYHMEHHLVASIPAYRLSAFHKYLQQRKCLTGVEIKPGYKSVIQQMLKPA